MSAYLKRSHFSALLATREKKESEVILGRMDWLDLQDQQDIRGRKAKKANGA